jgi:hypothetical protein
MQDRKADEREGEKNGGHMQAFGTSQTGLVRQRLTKLWTFFSDSSKGVYITDAVYSLQSYQSGRRKCDTRCRGLKEASWQC